MKFSQTKILGLTLLLVGLILAGFGLSLLSSPPQFQATARILSESDYNDYNDLQPNQSAVFDPYFIQTTFEILQSEVILSNVVTTLNLETVWGNKFANGRKLSCPEAMDRLKAHMVLARIHNTKLYTVSVRSEDPMEAAKLANAISDAFIHYREETQRQHGTESLKILQQQSDDQTQEIQILQTNLEKLRQQLGITNLPEASNPQFKSYHEAKNKLETLTKQHELFLSKLAADQMQASIPKAPMVQIVDVAMPPTSPVSPNRFYGGAMLVLGLITVFGGLSLSLSKR